MPVTGEYVLLPQGTLAPPNHGILYAQIVEDVTMAHQNPLNVSTKKRKKGWRLKVLTDPPMDLEVPKHLVISSVPSEILSEELETKPREFLGTFVAKQMSDAKGQAYPNYGQIVDLIAPTEEDGECGYLVAFRPLHNGIEIADHVFLEDEISSHDVTIQQYALGLGMGELFTDPEGQALRYADELEKFPSTATLGSWQKSFMSVVIAPPTCIILNDRLDPTEIDLDRVLDGYTGLRTLIVPNEPFKRSLSQEFSDFNIATSPGVSGVNPKESIKETNVQVEPSCPVTPFTGTATMAQNKESLPIVKATTGHIVSSGGIASMQSRNAVRQLMRQTASKAQAMPNPVYPSQGGYDPSTFKQQHMANKLAYVPTEPQMHKHSVTFRSGVYGKSNTRVEHMAGIEIVFEVEQQYAATRANAIIRAKCIMAGAMHTAPMQVWETAEADSFTFEEVHGDIQWSKVPEVTLVAIDDFALFWRLYNQFQLAACRYYIDDYSRVLEHIKQNLMAGFMQCGGQDQFIGLRRENRVTTLQCAIKYMRAVIGKYMNEMLLPGTTVPVIQWLSTEGVQGALFFGQVSTKWQAIQLRDLRAQMTPRGGMANSGKASDEVVPSKLTSKGNNGLSPELKLTIPKQDGVNACLVSFTNKGCNNPKCTYKVRTPAMGQLVPEVQEWLKKRHGSYKM